MEQNRPELPLTAQNNHVKERQLQGQGRQKKKKKGGGGLKITLTKIKMLPWMWRLFWVMPGSLDMFPSRAAQSCKSFKHNSLRDKTCKITGRITVRKRTIYSRVLGMELTFTILLLCQVYTLFPNLTRNFMNKCETWVKNGRICSVGCCVRLR